MSQHVHRISVRQGLGVTILVIANIHTVPAFSQQQRCPAGYQPYGDRCVSQRMADYISCIEASGGNREELADEVSRSGGNKASGGIEASGATLAAKGSAAVVLDKSTEDSLARKLRQRWYSNSMLACASILDGPPKADRTKSKSSAPSSIGSVPRGAKLLTPDFKVEGDHLIFTLSDRNRPMSARLVNDGESKLRYTFADIDDDLYLWPEDTPKEIPAMKMERMGLILNRSASAEEYRFVLQTGVPPDQRVQRVYIRVPPIRDRQDPVKDAVVSELTRFLSDPKKVGHLAQLPPGDSKASNELVRVVYSAVARQVPDLPVGAYWILTSDLLAASNWPDLAVTALRQAESESGSIVKSPSVQKLAGTVAAQSGEGRVFVSAETSKKSVVGLNTMPKSMTSQQIDASLRLAALLTEVPAFKAYGLSLEGDLLYVKGEKQSAKLAYASAAAIQRSPSIASRIAALDTSLTPGLTLDGAIVVKIGHVGHVGSLSGAIAHLGKDDENGAKMAIDELNAKATMIGGKKVKFELLAEDDGTDPKQGTSIAQKLVDAKVNGVIGHLNSGTTIPASKVYFEAGIPQISTFTISPKYTQQGFKTAFRVVATDGQLGGALGRYAVQINKAKRIAVIDDGTAYGQGVAEEFIKGVKGNDGSVEIVSQQYTNDKATDFNAILTAIKSKNPDVIFFGGMDAVAGPLLRQMNQLGIKAKFMGGDGICTEQLPTLAGGAISDGQVVCAEAGGVVESDKKNMDDFKAAYKKKFGVDAQINAPYEYDAVMTMVEAMKKANSPEPAKYLPVLANIQHKGVTGNIAFDPKGDIKDGKLTLYTYKGGKRQLLAVTK